ncbi:undecaprenyldiphospho-muramoylpentapeptide beta-N-acetylglucosaminyltransferase [soil metagenome]
MLPAVAIVEEIRRRQIPATFLWIGSTVGVEQQLAEENRIPFQAIKAGKLRRYIDLKTVPDAVRIPIGTVQSWRILRKFKPDVVFSTGGFVSVPTVVAATRQYPVLTHEQTATVGLANRINMQFTEHIALSFPETVARLSGSRINAILTGNPIRASIVEGDANRGLSEYGFTADIPLLFVTGGARGASPLNTRVEAVLPNLLEICQVLHQTGPPSMSNDFHRLSERREQLPANLRSRYQVRQFIGKEIGDVFAASSMVLCRSGAGMVAELAALGKPAILVPLPGSGGGEQAMNARILGDIHAALVLNQESATPDELLRHITLMITDNARLAEMSENARRIGSPRAAAALTDLLLRVAETTQSR